MKSGSLQLSPLRFAALADMPEQPWRNGAGRTRELLAWPQAQDWHIRISVADIERDAPFSVFAGIDRWFAVISGRGVRLSDAAATVVLREGAAPWRFDGERAPTCSLLEGPTRDLNLMLRRERMRGRLEVAYSGLAWVSDAPFRALFSVAPVTLSCGSAAHPVPAMTLAWTDDAVPNERWVIEPAQAARGPAWWIEATPHAAHRP
jgi:environmental stress-induced protein Ves